MSSVSRLRSGCFREERPLVRAASTIALLVTDLEPGTPTVASTGVDATGAGQRMTTACATFEITDRRRCGGYGGGGPSRAAERSVPEKTSAQLSADGGR